MAEWRDILEVVSKAEWRESLEKAADNLSMDLGQGQQPAGWPASQPDTGQSSFAASRNLLARELGTAPVPAAPAQIRPQRRPPQQRERTMPSAAGRASITRSIGQPAQAGQQPAAKERRAMRELVTVSVSAGIVATAIYGFFALLH